MLLLVGFLLKCLHTPTRARQLLEWFVFLFLVRRAGFDLVMGE